MNSRVRVTLSVLVSAVLGVAACSPPGPACGPGNCSGCCNGSTCESGTSPLSCGTGGLDCDVCVSPQVCGVRCQSPVQACQPESDAAFCARKQKTCGAVTGQDNCGLTRTAVCGQLAETDAALCTASQRCGAVTAVDRCGVRRTLSCACERPFTCGGGGVPGECGCYETDADFCTRVGKTCGSVFGTDACGRARTAQCGSCSAPASCSERNVCVCAPESDEQLCSARGASCGALSTTDRCGRARTIASCGSCGAGTSCGVTQANQCSCAPETDAQLCSLRGASCGALSTTDRCGRWRSIASCGTCSGADTCGATQVHQCGCAAETDAQLCASRGANCGALSTTDRCDRARTITSCGTCSGPTSCGAISAHQCGCVPPTNAELCTQLGATCGVTTAVDVCGTQRTATCGTCTAPLTCSAASPRTCCTPERDDELCQASHRVCGAFSTLDGCGAFRTVTSCGTCADGVCDGRTGTCCTPETDASFCSHLGRTCGAASGTDSCGQQRTVDSCGACGASAPVCAPGGACCTPETDPQFCARLNRTCGATSGVDNCGTTRSVTNCGTCPAGSCAASGRCCAPSCSGKQCGDDGCGGSCGTCSSSLSCLANGTCGQVSCDPVTQSPCPASQRCTSSSGASTGTCTSVVGSGRQGSSCVSDSQCGRALLCTQVSGSQNCRAYCRSNNDCDSTAGCAYSLGALGVCTTACNPTGGTTGCQGSEGCYVFNVPGRSEVTDCLAWGTGGQGDACSQPNDCFTGYACASNTCRRVCRLGSSCTSGTCRAVTGWSTYGLCM